MQYVEYDDEIDDLDNEMDIIQKPDDRKGKKYIIRRCI